MQILSASPIISRLILAGMVCLLAAAAVEGQSNVYRYQDKSGRYYYVDAPEKIPEQYRQKNSQPHALPSITREKPTGSSKYLGLKRRHDPLPEVEPEVLLEDTLPTVSEDSENDAGFDQSAPAAAGSLSTGMAPVIALVGIVVGLVNLAAFWKLFEMGGQPGWAIIVPIYNVVILSRLSGRSGWWILWFLFPVIGVLIWSLTVYIPIAQSHGRGAAFGLGMAILPIIFVPILVFCGEASASKVR
jgi:hypothetical protein